jgi:hypothetical protein
MKLMKLMVAMGLAIICCAPLSADTVDLKVLIEEKLQQQKKLADMTVEQKSLDADKQKLDAQAARNQKLERELKDRSTEWSMSNNENEARKQAALNSGCRPGQKTTDIALARRCNEAAAKINAETDRLQASGEKILADRKKLENDKEQLSKDTVAWSLKKKHNSDVIDDLNRRIADITQYLSGHCKSVPSEAKDEAIKHGCGNVQFDGERPKLDPCQTDECKAAEALFGRKASR